MKRMVTVSLVALLGLAGCAKRAEPPAEPAAPVVAPARPVVPAAPPPARGVETLAPPSPPLIPRSAAAPPVKTPKEADQQSKVITRVRKSDSVPAVAQALTAKEIMGQVEKVQKMSKDRKATMSMKLVGKRGDIRERKLVTYFKTYGDDSKSILFFLEPVDFKGKSFLQFDRKGKDDEQWIYLPSVGRVRQIRTSEKNQPFEGTDFTYDDLSMLTSRDVEKDEHNLLTEESVDGAPCWKIESKSKTPKEEDQYSKVITWVRKSDSVPAKVEFYDTKGELLKVLTLKDIVEISGIPTAKRLEMKNLQKSTSTSLGQDQIEYNTGLSDDLFTPRQMEKGEP